MNFSIHQVGDSLPTGIQEAVDMLNRNQTIWKLHWPPKSKIDKPGYDPTEILSALPAGLTSGLNGPSFVIGVTKGMVSIDPKFSLIDYSKRNALVTDYRWRLLGNSVSPKLFWAFTLANICFQAIIEEGCGEKSCLGFREHSVSDLALKLLELQICNQCQKRALLRFKYQLPEIRRLIDGIKRYKEFEDFPTFQPPPNLPVLERQIKRQIAKGNTRLFEGYGIVIIMHFLQDLIPFLEGLIKLGARRESISLIVKPYPYSQRLQVHSYLLKNHDKIRIEYLHNLPPGEDILRDVVEHCRAKSDLGKLIVIEDGGYIVPFLHSNYAKEENFCIGAVEQTTKGLRRDEGIIKYQFPVLDVAKSKFKDEYEAPLVGRTVVSSICNLLKDEDFSGKTAVVFGFGAIGRQVAKALRDLGMIVKICDSKTEAIIAARNNSFEGENSPLRFIGNAKLIVGTTGYLSIGSDTLEHIKNGAILVSASSDLVEIDIEHLRIIANELRYEEGLGTYFVRKDSISTDTYLLIADGFPINFYAGSGIPNKAIDPILTQMFIGATQIIGNYGKFEPGINNVMDEVIKECKLLEDYLAIQER